MRFFPRLFSWRPLRFLISGGTAAVVNLSTLFILVDVAGVWYLPATAVAYAAAIGVSFVMQKFFTFNDYGTVGITRQSALYAGLQICNLGINTALVYVSVEYLRTSYLLAQLLSGGIIAAYTFMVLRHFLFVPEDSVRTLPPSACPSCDGTAQAEWGRKNNYRLARCFSCGLIFVSPMPSDTAKLYGADYFSGGRDFGYVEYDRDKKPMRRTFETYLMHMEQTLGRKGKLLDVGCATGYFMEIARTRGWDVEGVDVSEHASSVGREKGLIIHTGVLPHVNLAGKHFDAVTFFDVIEHLSDPRAALLEGARLLKDGGILVVTAPDSGTLWARLLRSRWHLIVPPEHLVWFNRKNFADMLAIAGFKPSVITTIAKHFTLPYIFQTLYRWQKLSFWNALARFTDKRMGGVSIPINLRDTFFMIATKA